MDISGKFRDRMSSLLLLNKIERAIVLACSYFLPCVHALPAVDVPTPTSDKASLQSSKPSMGMPMVAPYVVLNQQTQASLV